MPVVHSFDEFVSALEKLKVPHRAVVSSREVELQSNTALPGPLVFRWETSVPFVTVRQYVLEDLPAERMDELEHAVVRVNHHLPVTGFGLDHLRRRLYYRVATPVFAGVDVDVLNRLAKGVLANAKEFAASFQAVASGRAGAEIAEIYKDYAQSRAAHFYAEGS
ncbi:MAG: hypothetical protein H6708_16605 [Kofleriaceae bacterium]|nr:hypothetical protein [Kofleriaceae bacterium]